MKKFQHITLVIIILLSGCAMEPSFVEPQPVNKKNEKKIKHKYQGEYHCLEDSSRLIISEDKIIQHWKIEFGISRAEIDSTTELSFVNGNLYSNNKKIHVNAELIGDTVFGIYEYSKTIFEISENSILRFDKGRYILNQKRSENNWNVKTLELSDDHLGIYKISGKEQIENLADFTEVKEITNELGEVTSYELNPTKREFKSILKASKFHEGTKFIKINKPL